MRTRPGLFSVSRGLYRTLGAPAQRRAAAWALRLLARGPAGLRRALRRLERRLAQLDHVLETFFPFIYELDLVFSTKRLRALYAGLPAVERELLPWEPEAIDWRAYWHEIHIPGLRRWVFPGFGERRPARPRPGPVSRLLRRGLDAAQDWFYTRPFPVRVIGAENIPAAPGFLVAGNHASHLDMGAIKTALGPVARELGSLAAADYFFDTALKRWFFGNFTGLVPMNRRAGFRQSLQLASRHLREGRSLLIFPEGTRSLTGRLGPFRPSVGYLALHNQVDVLPVYLLGAFEAMPKGRLIPRPGTLTVVVGRPIRYDELRRRTRHLAGADAWRAASAMIEEAVRRLENGARPEPGAVPPPPLEEPALWPY